MANSRFYAAGMLLAATCCIAVISWFSNATTVMLWGVSVVLVLLWELWRLRNLWKGTALPQQQHLSSCPGPANQVTLLRGGLIALLAGFAVLSAPLPPPLLWCVALLYSLAAFADGLDGYLARRFGSSSQLGARLDTEFDALGMLVAPLTGVLHSRLPPEYLLVSIAYYVFKGAAYLRVQRGLTVFALPSSTRRRTLAGFQMGFVAIALYPVYPLPAVRVAAWAFMLPFLWGFLNDWLAVSAHPLAPRLGASHWLASSMAGLMLRGFVCLTLIACIRTGGMTLLTALAVMMFLLPGIATRSAATFLMLFTGAQLTALPGHLSLQILLFGSALLSICGGGSPALWSPEERWLDR